MGYGKLFMLLLAIGVILIGTSGKGYELWQVLTGKARVQPLEEPNPTDMGEND